MRFLDASVSGGMPGTGAGTLAIMASGSLHDFTEAAPVYSALGRAQVVGPEGRQRAGYEVMQSMIVGAMINIVAEALLLAQAAVADPADVRETIRGGFAGSRLREVHGQRMLDRNFVPRGQVKSQLKDLRNVLDAAAEAGLGLTLRGGPAHR